MTFGDIPSLSWQITTILIGVGASASLLVSFTILYGCCLSGVITQSTAKVLGWIQFIAALLTMIGGAVYPLGWTSREVKDACEHSNIYQLGNCRLSLSSFMLISGTVTLLLCFILSFKASKVSVRPFRV